HVHFLGHRCLLFTRCATPPVWFPTRAGSGQHMPEPGVEKIAVLRANALGDFIFALPALDALRAAYPAAELVLLGAPWHARLLTGRPGPVDRAVRSEEHTSELQSRGQLVCRLLLEKKKTLRTTPLSVKISITFAA